MGPMRQKKGAVGVVLVGAISFLLGVYIAGDLFHSAPQPSRASRDEKETSSFAQAAALATPAVVHIQTEGAHGEGDRRLPGLLEGDRFFREFFEQFRGEPRRSDPQISLGSGVIIDRRGYIITNNHVVKGADRITVPLNTEKELKAEVVGRDLKTDLAVIQVESDQELPEAILGDSDQLRVGEWALAIGNPFGLDHTVTVGVISATGRSELGVLSYENFIQTDASINPGNSGGPLLNVKGEVIGINTAIAASGQGIGFAIPINLAKRIARDLIVKGRVVRGWLGIGPDQLRVGEWALAIGNPFGLDHTVTVGVISATGRSELGVLSYENFIQTDASINPGNSGGPLLNVKGEVIGINTAIAASGQGIGFAIPINLAKRIARDLIVKGRVVRGWLGIGLQSLNEDLARSLNVSPHAGILISHVAAQGPGARSGLKPGDVITTIGKRKVRTPEEV